MMSEMASSLAQLVTLLTMAKECIPTIKTAPLLTMQMKNGVSSLQNVFVNGRPLYTHHDKVIEDSTTGTTRKFDFNRPVKT